MFGRRQIFTDVKNITAENIVAVLKNAYTEHLKNRGEIEYLYKYYRGEQPILNRVKEVRPEICAQIAENVANEIVSFKVGYLCGEPIQYVSREGREGKAVDKLNAMMLSECKAAKDKELVEWDMICGTAYRLVLPDNRVGESDEAAFELYSLDPRNTFVIYSNDVRRIPVAAVCYTTDKDSLENRYSIYTSSAYYEVYGDKVVSASENLLGIPIIEYPANNARLGAFEIVLPLLDAINLVDSNRLDGIEQQIQSLLVFYNAELEEGTDANAIREAGLVKLRSTSENKADVKEIATVLDQSSAQTYKEDLYNRVLAICGMPAQGNGNTSDSSNNGSTLVRLGWTLAEARAKDSELMFKQSEQEFLKILLRILNASVKGFSLKLSSVDYKFTRRNYEDIATKSQVLIGMLGSDKIAPRLAFAYSGMFSDPEAAWHESEEWAAAHPAVEAPSPIGGNDAETSAV